MRIKGSNPALFLEDLKSALDRGYVLVSLIQCGDQWVADLPPLGLKTSPKTSPKKLRLTHCKTRGTKQLSVTN